MKNSIIKKAFILFGVIISLSATAQTTLSMGMLLSKPNDDFSENDLKRVETKLAQVISNSSEVVMGTQNDFVIIGKLVLNDVNTVDGSLSGPKTVATVDFSLFVKQLTSGTVYGSTSKILKGVGSNKATAINNAINYIQPNDESISQLIKSAKQKILKYYTDNCDQIIQTANGAASLKDYPKALALLQSIPNGISCYEKAQQQSIPIYLKYQTALCGSNVTKAKAAVAVNDFSTALYYLYQIDPTATCNAEVNKLINQISTKYDKYEARENDLEKVRIDAIKEIGKAYYSQQVSSYSLILF